MIYNTVEYNIDTIEYKTVLYQTSAFVVKMTSFLHDAKVLFVSSEINLSNTLQPASLLCKI